MVPVSVRYDTAIAVVLEDDTKQWYRYCAAAMPYATVVLEYGLAGSTGRDQSLTPPQVTSITATTSDERSALTFPELAARCGTPLKACSL